MKLLTTTDDKCGELAAGPFYEDEECAGDETTVVLSAKLLDALPHMKTRRSTMSLFEDGEGRNEMECTLLVPASPNHERLLREYINSCMQKDRERYLGQIISSLGAYSTDGEFCYSVDGGRKACVVRHLTKWNGEVALQLLSRMIDGNE